jgi:hypothetical protein
MTSQMGGAALVYIHRMGSPARHADLCPIFDDAPCDVIGLVEEQKQFMETWLESLINESGIS